MSTTRGAAVAAWWPWLALPAVATGLVSAGLALGLTDPDGNWIKGEAWVNIPLAIGFSTVAAGIWSTRPHPVGLRRLAVLYTVVGLAAALVLPTHGWALSDAAGAAFAAWVSNWVWSLGAAPLLGIGLLLYPGGHPPSRRWWPAAGVGLAGMATITASAALRPGPLEDHPEFSNAVGLGSRDFWDAVGGVGFALLMLGAVLGVASLVVKFRRAPAGGDVRGQIGGFSLAGALVVVASSLPTTDDLTATLFGVAAVSALPITVGAAVVRHHLLDQRGDVEGLNRRVKDLSTSRRHIVNEREEERVRLRRDLHDGLGPSLAAIGLGLRQIEQRTGGGDGVRELADEVQRAVSEVRRICDGLRPAALNELGLAGALTESIEPLQRFGPRITLNVGELPRLAPAVEVAAFRIVMEAVTNAVRHADAQHVQVKVGYDDGVEVEVTDDGEGLAEDRVPASGSAACPIAQTRSAAGSRSDPARPWGPPSTPGFRWPTMTEPVRVLVVEDHPLYRKAVTSLVDGMDGWQVIGSYADAEAAIPQALEADLVVLDLGLPGVDGIEATRLLKAANPEVAILVLTMSHAAPLLTAAVRAGAQGYLVKGSEPEDIERALRAVARGQVVFGEQVAAAVLAQAGRRTTVAADSLFPMLSGREVEVLDLIAAGKSNAEIASSLFVSPKTAKNHVSSILAKLGCTRPEAVVRARDAGLGRS